MHAFIDKNSYKGVWRYNWGNLSVKLILDGYFLE